MSTFDLVDDVGFRTGLTVGFAALVATVVVALGARAVIRVRARARMRRGRMPEPHAPVAGFALAIAGVIALEDTYAGFASDRLLLGLGLLAAGPTVVALVVRRGRFGALVAAVAAVPGAAVIGRAAADVNPLAWVEVLVVGGIVVGGLLTADVDRFHARAGLGPVLFVLTVGGCYVTLPDTEYSAVLLGVALPLALLGFPHAFATLGPGTYVTLGILAWVAAVEGRGRNSAVVGAFACLGVLALEPVVRRALRSRARVLPSPTSPSTLAVIALQCAVVLVTSRIAGLEPSATEAGVISLGAWVAGALVLAALLFRPRGHAARRDRPRPGRTDGATPTEGAPASSGEPS